MANRREFSAKTRKAAIEPSRQQQFRERFEASNGIPRSKSANLKWLEALVSSPWPEACVLWPFAKRAAGYGTIIWKYKRTTAHRVSCELAHGQLTIPTMHAAHRCGNRECCNPAHLRWATPEQNAADKVAHGTQTRGESSPASKLTSGQVNRIREMLDEGSSLPRIAKEVGCSKSNVWMIKARKTWVVAP